jgi:tRNA(Ile)-lysidine synthase
MRPQASPPLAHRFREHVEATALLPPDAPLTVALSGGLDSQVLLHLLRYVVRRRGPLCAAHFDHRMRRASGHDAAWCAGLCAAWQVPLIAASATSPLHSETDARTARYAFLAAVARLVPGARIATAHHADDQAETILYRILRGTGVRGLAGIPATRGVFVRPLLPFARAELEAYAAANGIRARFDPTNYDVRRPRNAIRHLLLPFLERARPGARELIVRLGTHAASAGEAFDALLDEAERHAVTGTSEREIRLARQVFRAYHPEIRALLLRRLLGRHGRAPGRVGTRAAVQFISADRGGGRIDLPGGIQLERRFDDVVLRRASSSPAEDVPVAIPEAGGGEARARIGGREFVVRWQQRSEAATADGARVDPNAVRFPLFVRGWRPGDRIRMAYGSKKLKKLFGELRLDREARSRTPVLAEGRDRILWVVGHARSMDARPADGPALHITVTDG